jgi:hypothetical protein
LNITALSVEELARVLAAAGGGGVSRQVIEQHLAAGAPRNPDGTMNLIHYAAWLVRSEAVHAD